MKKKTEKTEFGNNYSAPQTHTSGAWLKDGLFGIVWLKDGLNKEKHNTFKKNPLMYNYCAIYIGYIEVFVSLYSCFWYYSIRLNVRLYACQMVNTSNQTKNDFGNGQKKLTSIHRGKKKKDISGVSFNRTKKLQRKS